MMLLAGIEAGLALINIKTENLIAIGITGGAAVSFFGIGVISAIDDLSRRIEEAISKK